MRGGVEGSTRNPRVDTWAVVHTLRVMMHGGWSCNNALWHWLLVLSYLAICHTAYATNPPVPVTELPFGRSEVPHHEWEVFLRENLHADLKPWIERVRKDGPLNATRVLDLVAYLKAYAPKDMPSAVHKLCVIYNSRIYWPERNDVGGDVPSEPVAGYIKMWHVVMTKALKTGHLKLPNMVLVYNAEDNKPRFCSVKRNCSVPLVSQIKTIDGDGEDTDLLVPQVMTVQPSLYSLPWHLKNDTAFFRGHGFRNDYWLRKYGYNDACPRTYLAWRSMVDQQQGRPMVLDVALTDGYQVLRHENGTMFDNQVIRADLPRVERVPMAEHARHKYLLQLEGISASYRLSLLFQVNSLVLFQRQPFIEYHYRSLKEGVHYVGFWNDTTMDDVYDVIKQVQAQEAADPAWPQRIIHNAQTFAAKFSSMHARVMYTQAALTEYRKLFDGSMDLLVEQLVADMRGRGFPIPAAA